MPVHAGLSLPCLPCTSSVSFQIFLSAPLCGSGFLPSCFQPSQEYAQLFVQEEPQAVYHERPYQYVSGYVELSLQPFLLEVGRHAHSRSQRGGQDAVCAVEVACGIRRACAEEQPYFDVLWPDALEDPACPEKGVGGQLLCVFLLQKLHIIGYILPDSFANAAHSEEADEGYMSCLNLTGDGMMGYVEVPKIHVKLPIFHTTDEEVLQTAAGHLEGSSLPVGGEGTHAVISAHRGLPSAALFTDLDRLSEGDCFLLYILDDVLCYKVDQISVVEPEDTSALAAEDGLDLVTLLTCTPYGVNSHRLLVRGHRVPYEEIEDEAVAASDFLGPSLHTNYVLWVVIGLSATGLFIFLLYLYDKKSHKAAVQTESQDQKA